VHPLNLDTALWFDHKQQGPKRKDTRIENGTYKLPYFKKTIARGRGRINQRVTVEKLLVYRQNLYDKLQK
jgi:hypothetical protein